MMNAGSLQSEGDRQGEFTASQKSATMPAEHATARQAVRRMRPGRFLLGLLLTTLGVAAILLLGVGMLHQRRLDRPLALPLAGFVGLAGVLLLSGGFCMMASASAGFDEEEFERLMHCSPVHSTHQQRLRQALHSRSRSTPTTSDSLPADEERNTDQGIRLPDQLQQPRSAETIPARDRDVS